MSCRERMDLLVGVYHTFISPSTQQASAATASGHTIEMLQELLGKTNPVVTIATPGYHWFLSPEQGNLTIHVFHYCRLYRYVKA
jgi:hypothetical protein